MKFATVVYSALLCLALLGGILQVHAQNAIPFKHIVLVIQENRTPDNLFAAAPSAPVCGQSYAFEPGVDIQDGGWDKSIPGLRCLAKTPLAVCWDVGHKNTDWNTQADLITGTNMPQMDGACSTQIYPMGPGCAAPTCAPYSYVQKPDVQPYFDIATNYGFANYMFESPEGPSFPTHLFLLTGTSAPVAPGQANYLDFVAENPASFRTSGCPYNHGLNYANWVDPAAQPLQGTLPCYEHPTLVDQFKPHNVSWRYYAPSDGTIWTVVDAIQHLCYDQPPYTGPCNSEYWTHMSFESPGNGAPVLSDIGACQLQNVSWVIPDERWSDHPGFNDYGTGPYYVADIVNAIGNSRCTDTVNGQNYTYWQDTAIFILWDDWGGFYDHVPPQVLRQIPGTNLCPNPDQTWGCGYTEGFRVPLLVVSAYTPAGYVSGIYPNPGKRWPYVHDFGSILRFIELNFLLTQIAPPPYTNEYADINAPDAAQNNVPLSDFFQGQYRSFSAIQVPPTMGPNSFINYFVSHPGESPLGPDGGDAD